MIHVTQHQETYYTCNRCGERFVRRSTHAHETVTAEYALMVLTNGSGSRASTPGRDLDQDLCVPCTAGLLAYLRSDVDDHGGARAVNELLGLRARLDMAVDEARDRARGIPQAKLAGLLEAVNLVDDALVKLR